MAPTHTAVRAPNLIIQWLPDEILAAVMWELRPPDLATVCKTSRLIRDTAAPILYRAVELSNDTQVEIFSRTVISPTASSPSLFSLLREFAVTQLGLNQDSVHSTAMLERAYFPNLTTFKMTVNFPTPTFASMVARFVNRHQKITCLNLLQAGAPQSDGIHVPDPSSCSGLSAFTSLILRENFLCAKMSYVPPDPDEIPLPQPDATPNEITILVQSDSLTASIILAGVVAHLPHTRGLELMAFSDPPQIYATETTEIEAYLAKLHFLSNWGLRSHTDCKNPQYDTSGDEAIVTAWSAACPSLSSTTFHGRTWQRVDGRWNILKNGSEAVAIA
ncbi:hypothetical protein C8R45DRAFT_1224747 [Mycena sanguinolenta]|nr:hypothetical protein C8R45DRAFT_1224747 [Mycena sanguinolenta]